MKSVQLPYQPQSDNESKIVAAIIPLEEGVHDWDNDRGGPTAHGIIEERAHEYGYEIADITPDIARAIIADHYYHRPKFNSLSDIRLQYRMTLDGLHSGCEGRVMRLQEVCNISNFHGRRWDDIEVDGDIGPKTLKALRMRRTYHKTQSDNMYYLKLCARLYALQAAKYHEIIAEDASQEDYERGWYNRILNKPEWYEFGGLYVH